MAAGSDRGDAGGDSAEEVDKGQHSAFGGSRDAASTFVAGTETPQPQNSAPPQ